MPTTNETTTVLPKVMPFKRACRESGFNYSTMRDAAHRGLLTVIVVGKAWYIDPAELMRFCRDHSLRHTRGEADRA